MVCVAVTRDGSAASDMAATIPRPRAGVGCAEMPDQKSKLEALSMEIRSGASEEMRAVLAGDMVKWGRLVKDRNIQIAQ